ncbi:MAG: D-3-phosphoglycerate dehydrogenase [Salibacteraceae bacterium]|jgi:D-3-phosphoglycerate dehydrogenase
MSKIAISDYFDEPSDLEKSILGDLVSAKPNSDTEVLLVWHEHIDENYISQFPKLRGVQRYGVGFDSLDLEALSAKGIVACNNPDYGVDEVSDTALAFIMLISRGVMLYDVKAQKLFDSWQENVLPHIKRNKDIRLGIIGSGRIGTSVLLKAKSIGFDTVFFDPFKEIGHEKVVKADRVKTLNELLSQSDIISIHCPLNEETTGLINREFIKAMKEGSSLVNTARGGLLADTDLVYDALHSNHLQSVALDVIPNEPPKNDRLISAWRNQEDWLKGRLFINPHTSYFSQASILDMRRTAAENALRMFNGEKPYNQLT